MEFWQRVYAPNLKKLVGFAAFGGIATGVMGLLVIQKRDRELKDLPFHNRALSMFKSNYMAMSIVGIPIKLLGIDSTDSEHNYVRNSKAALKIPFKGMKKSGDLYVWADFIKQDNSWCIEKLELKLKEDESKTFLIYDRSKQESIEQEKPIVNLKL